MQNGREALRLKYLPEDVRVLFVGESPPAGGTFFYSKDSGLYRATKDAFLAAFPGADCGEDFLDAFARAGCYLEDLCPEPVNHAPAAERLRLRRESEPRLAQTLKDVRPRAAIVLLKGITPNVRRCVLLAGMPALECHAVTYPSRWKHHREAYQMQLQSILRGLRERGILGA